MPRRNSAKALSPKNVLEGAEKVSDTGDVEQSQEVLMEVEVSEDSKKRSLEALFQAAKSELQHIEGQGHEEVETSVASNVAPYNVTFTPSQNMVYDAGQEQMVDIGSVTFGSATPSTPITPQVGRKRKHPATPGKYVCSYCGRGCAKPSVLEKHIRAHTGERPYPCKICGFAFKTKSNLYKHCKSRAHAMKVAGTPGIETVDLRGQFSSVEDELDESGVAEDSLDSETAQASVNISREEKEFDEDRVHLIEPQQVQMLGSEASGEQSALVNQNLTSEDANVDLVIDSDPDGDGKDLKYYIVEVKQGESLEQVVKRAKVTSNSESRDLLTEADVMGNYEDDSISQAKHDEESSQGTEVQTFESLESEEMSQANVVQSEQCEQIIEIFEEGQDIDSVRSKVERVNDNTVQVQIQLLPPGKKASVTPMQAFSRSRRQGYEIVNTPDSSASKPSKINEVKHLTPEDIQARISKLINMNQEIVNTPMADPPRPKRASKQSSSSSFDVAGSKTPNTSSIHASTTSTPQLYIQGDDGKIHQLVIASPTQVIPISSLDQSFNSNTPLVSTPATAPLVIPLPSQIQKLKQYSSTSENNVIKDLLLKPPRQTTVSDINLVQSEGSLDEGGLEESGVQYFCTACSSIFTNKQTMLSHAQFHCPANVSESEHEQSEAVRTLLSQDSDPFSSFTPTPQEQLQQPSTPLVMHMVDPSSPAPLKRGRPKGSTKSQYAPLLPQTPEELAPVMTSFTLNSSASQKVLSYQPPGHSDAPVRSSSHSSKPRPQLKLLIPPAQGFQPTSPKSNKKLSMSNVSQQSSTPLPEWKLKLKDKLLKRSMSVERLAASATVTNSATSRYKSDTSLAASTIRPILKRSAAFDEEIPSKKSRFEGSSLESDSSSKQILQFKNDDTASVVTESGENDHIVSIKPVKMDEENLTYDDNMVVMYAEDKGELIVVTQNEDEKRDMEIECADQNLEMKEVTIKDAGKSCNVIANILQCSLPEIVTRHDTGIVMNKTLERKDISKPVVAMTPHKHPQKLPVLKITTTAAQKIPGLISKWRSDKPEQESDQLQIDEDQTKSKTLNNSSHSHFDKQKTDVDGFEVELSSSGILSVMPPPTEMHTIPEHLQDKAAEVLLMLGHSYPIMNTAPHVTFCSLLKPQPMYVQQQGQGISMYSNWQTPPHPSLPMDLTLKQLFALHHTRLGKVDPLFQSAGLNQPHHLTDSSYWTEAHGEDEGLTGSGGSSASEEPNSKTQPVQVIEEVFVVDQAGNVVNQQGEQVIIGGKTTRTLINQRHKQQFITMDPMQKQQQQQQQQVKSESQPKGSKVRICKGGYRTDEDYVYVRGRGRGKYVCEECGIRCKKPSMLRKHIHTHTDMRPFTCRYCRFSFKTKGNLTKHMKSKSHAKRCIELGIHPVPTSVDDPSTDTQAMQRLQQLIDQGIIPEGESMWVMEGEEDEAQFQDAAADAAAEDMEDEDEEDDDGEEEVEEEVVIDDNIQVIEETVGGGQLKSLQNKTTTKTDPVYIAVQTTKGEQPMYVKIAPKPQRLLEGEVAASLLDLSQTRGQKADENKNEKDDDKASDEDGNKNDPRLTNIVSELMSRTNKAAAMEQAYKDGRREAQQVIHLMREAAQVKPDVKSPITMPSDSLTSGFVPPILDNVQVMSSRSADVFSAVKTSASTTQQVGGLLMANTAHSAADNTDGDDATGNLVQKPIPPVDQPIVLKQEGLKPTTSNIVIKAPEDVFQSKEQTKDTFTSMKLEGETKQQEANISTSAPDQGPVQIVTLPTGQTISIPVSVLNLHGLPAVVPSQIPLGVRVVPVGTSQQHTNLTGRQVASSESRTAPFEIQPIPGKVVSTEAVDGKYICDVCNADFPKHSQLQVHKNIHFFERPFKCESCNVSFKTKGMLEKHEKSESHQQKAALRKEFPLPTVAESGDKDNPRPHQCEDCGIAFRIHGHLSKHLKSKLHITKLESLGKIPSGTYELLERTCFRGVVATDNASARTSIMTLVAKKLGVSEVSSNDTITMTSTGNPVLVKGSEKNTSDVDRTSKSIASTQPPNASSSLNVSSGSNKCGICGLSFPSVLQLKNHLVLHAELRPYVCQHCDAGFTTANSLTQHLRSHSMEQVCNDCGISFSDLQEHKNSGLCFGQDPVSKVEDHHS